MTIRVMNRVRRAIPASTVLYIGDILLNLLIAGSGVALFMIAILFLA